MKAVRSTLLILGLTYPTASLASGDPGIIWWLGGTALLYLAIAVLLVLMLKERRIRWRRLLLYVFLTPIAW